MDVWNFIHQNLDASNPMMLLHVLSSEGSSPGRQGFKMAVTLKGDFFGTIGGGIMEKKLVTKAKSLLAKNKLTGSLLVHQYHDKTHSPQSGMICSGSQLVAFIPLSFQHKKMIKQIVQHQPGDSPVSILISSNQIQLSFEAASGLNYKSDNEWKYSEQLHQLPVLHIFGGGHVSLALSELMKYLGFIIHVYDDRKELNTMQQNTFAHQKHYIDYTKLHDTVSIHENDFIVIMTIGYRTDKIVLKQLLNKKRYYLGLLGSNQKIKKLFGELKDEGIREKDIKKIFAPVGISILSQTTQEIAVSIAAEIINEKNKFLPTGRV